MLVTWASGRAGDVLLRLKAWELRGCWCVSETERPRTLMSKGRKTMGIAAQVQRANLFFTFFILLESSVDWDPMPSSSGEDTWSCFCWLYRASPSLAAKNIINLILVLTSGDVHVYSHLLCCWKRVFAMTSVFSWQNSISLCPVSFRTPRPNLPIIPGASWLPTFAFQSPIMKRTSFGGVSSKRSCRSS